MNRVLTFVLILLALTVGLHLFFIAVSVGFWGLVMVF